jgi:hypothetical protein
VQVDAATAASTCTHVGRDPDGTAATAASTCTHVGRDPDGTAATAASTCPTWKRPRRRCCARRDLRPHGRRFRRSAPTWTPPSRPRIDS